MDKEKFIQYLLKKKKSQRTISDYTDYVAQYEKYLHKQGKSLENTDKKDLHDFQAWGEKNDIKINRFLWGIKEYFEFIQKRDIQLEADILIGERYHSKFKLRDFVGVNSNTVKKLAIEGIVYAKEMVFAGRTKQNRLELSVKTGIPFDEILELVKLSDQSRIGGHKKIRARLYHEAGLDTIDIMAELEPDKLRKILVDYIEKTGFNGIPPTPGEAKHTVTMARHIKRIVQY